LIKPHLIFLPEKFGFYINQTLKIEGYAVLRGIINSPYMANKQFNAYNVFLGETKVKWSFEHKVPILDDAYADFHY
jgi:hypothetical protein